MSKSTLREAAKFGSGLILGDFLCGLWFYLGGYYSLKFWGMSFTPRTLIAGMLFDALLFIFLVYYGWHLANKPRTSRERKFHLAAGSLFTLVALFHLSRILFAWNMVLGPWVAPYWLNGVATLVTAFLAYLSFSLAQKE